MITPRHHLGRCGCATHAQVCRGAPCCCDGNTITGRWEIAEDFTNYVPDFDLTYQRVNA